MSETLVFHCYEEVNEMPDWCKNEVTFKHKDSAMMSRVKSAIENESLFNDFYPIPDGLEFYFSERNGPKGNENLAKFGYRTGYDFCNEEWGTKWDIDSPRFYDAEDDDDDLIIISSFNTAWSPPIAFYDKMVKNHGFSIMASFKDPGRQFSGCYANGVGFVVSDDLTKFVIIADENRFEVKNGLIGLMKRIRKSK